MKSYAKIAAKTTFTWIKVGLVGMLFSLLCIGISTWLVKKNYLSELSFSENLANNPLPFILLIGSVIAVFFYFILAKKITTMTLVNQVWQNKLSGFILPKIQVYTEKIISGNSDKLKGIAESNFVKQVTNSVKRDKTINRVQRLALAYGLKDINLSATDFSSDNISQILALKVESKIQSLTQPSFKQFWIFFFVQLFLLILSILLS